MSLIEMALRRASRQRQPSLESPREPLLPREVRPSRWTVIAGSTALFGILFLVLSLNLLREPSAPILLRETPQSAPTT